MFERYLPLDLQFSLRLLRKNYLFVSMCVLVIALGMASSIAMYEVVSAFGYSTLPYPDGDKYIVVKRIDGETGQVDGYPSSIDSYTYQYLASSVQSYREFGAYRRQYATFSDGEYAQQYYSAYISPNLLQATAVEPILGRALAPSDDVPGADPVVVLSYRLWQDYYGGQEDIVGQTSRVNGLPFTIIGVMPEGFIYPVDFSAWFPLGMSANLSPNDGQIVRVMGILAAGVSLDTASAEVATLIQQLGENYPEYYANYSALVRPFTQFILPSMTILHTMAMAVGAVLLLVCFNLANLLAVRSFERQQELAVRNALGATPWGLVKSVLLESLLICLLGAILSVFLADFGIRFLQLFSGGEGVPFWMKSYDWELSSLFVATLICILIWFFAGGMAAWRVSRQDPAVQLSGGKGSVESGSKAGMAILVASEIVFSCFLMILCGVTVLQTVALANKDLGTSIDGYLTGRIDIPAATYPDTESRENFRRDLQAELLNQEGVLEVSYATVLPGEAGLLSNYDLEDRNTLIDGRYPAQEVIDIAPNYFDTMDVPLLEGRMFDSNDTQSSLPVIIVDHLFAERTWPGESPLGKRIQINPGLSSSPWHTIVGVNAHIGQGNAAMGTVEPSLYRPITQRNLTTTVPDEQTNESRSSGFHLVFRTAGDPDSYRGPLQAALSRVDRDIAVNNLRTMEDVLAEGIGPVGYFTRIFSTIALITLVLAVTGIYAIVSRSVSQRTKEIGIRRALGSSDNKVLWLFIQQAFVYLSLGLVLGGGAAAIAANGIETLILGVGTWLPTVFISVSVGLGLLVFFAAYNPARKLVLIEPGDALHYE